MLLGWFACWLHAQISAHAQMKNQCPVVQVDEQEFSPPTQIDYLALLQPLNKLQWVRAGNCFWPKQIY